MAFQEAGSSQGRNEVLVADTAFGSVTDRRVQFQANKGWFGGGSQEDLPLRHVTSVRVETVRHIIIAAIFGFAALGCMASGDAMAVLIGLVFAAVAVFFMWGSPRVVLNTAGGDLRPSTGWPWLKPEAQAFSSAVRSQLFKD